MKKAGSDTLLSRNIRNSKHIIMGDFESVVEDIIHQLEEPPSDVNDVAPSELARRVADAIAQGLAGLHPNGFDFCTWLWDVAPLHVVRIPQSNELGGAFSFQFGVIHLRKISAMIARVYVAEQPNKISSVLEMLDSSIDVVDARNLISNALLDHYRAHFKREEKALAAMVQGEKRWRKLVAVAVAGDMLIRHPKSTQKALALIGPLLVVHPDEDLLRGLLFVFRSAVMYGDKEGLSSFLLANAASIALPVQTLLCDILRGVDSDWPDEARTMMTDVLQTWKASENGDPRNLTEVLTHFVQQ